MCKIVVSYLHFYQIIKNLKVKGVEVTITEDSFKIHNIIFFAKSTFINDDRIFVKNKKATLLWLLLPLLDLNQRPSD